MNTQERLQEIRGLAEKAADKDLTNIQHRLAMFDFRENVTEETVLWLLDQLQERDARIEVLEAMSRVIEDPEDRLPSLLLPKQGEDDE